MTDSVQIVNMIPMTTIHLASVKAFQVHLDKMVLSEVDTRALVTAMRKRVELSMPGSIGDTTLDIEELTKLLLSIWNPKFYPKGGHTYRVKAELLEVQTTVSGVLTRSHSCL